MNPYGIGDTPAVVKKEFDRIAKTAKRYGFKYIIKNNNPDVYADYFLVCTNGIFLVKPFLLCRQTYLDKPGAKDLQYEDMSGYPYRYKKTNPFRALSLSYKNIESCIQDLFPNRMLRPQLEIKLFVVYPNSSDDDTDFDNVDVTEHIQLSQFEEQLECKSQWEYFNEKEVEEIGKRLQAYARG